MTGCWSLRVLAPQLLVAVLLPVYAGVGVDVGVAGASSTTGCVVGSSVALCPSSASVAATLSK